MEQGKKLAIASTLVVLLAAGGRVAWQIHERHVAENATAPEEKPSYHLTADDNVYLKREHQMSLKDARELNGKRQWISAGGQMIAYSATPAHVDFTKPAGLLLGAEPIDIVNFIEQKATDLSSQRIAAGDKQAMMLFHRASDPSKLLGIPVGYLDGTVWTFYLDDMIFYQDPRELYKHWGAEIWKAVDAHRVIKGMNELQTQIALGQVSTPQGNSVGNRSVTYFNDNHPVTVLFEHNKATSISGQN